MPYPSASLIDSVETLMPQIVALSREWLERQDRHAPVPPPSIASINALLRRARMVLSREPGLGNVELLDNSGPVLPGALLIALLKAEVALDCWASRYSIVENGQLSWTMVSPRHCPGCGLPLGQALAEPTEP